MNPKIARLAVWIADSAAATTITSCGCPVFVRQEVAWYAFERGQPEHVKRAIRYLDLRGLLIRNPKDRTLIRPSRRIG